MKDSFSYGVKKQRGNGLQTLQTELLIVLLFILFWSHTKVSSHDSPTWYKSAMLGRNFCSGKSKTAELPHVKLDFRGSRGVTCGFARVST